MKRFLFSTVLALGLSCSALPACAQTFFEGLQLGEGKEAVLQKLEKKYQFIQEEKGKFALFEGKILDEPGKIIVVFSGEAGTLTHIFLGFDSGTLSYDQLMRKYSFYSAMLRQKYGVPDIARRHFTPPYRAGDGQELSAIREKKANIGSIWKVANTFISCLVGNVEPLLGTSVLIIYGDPREIKSL